MPRGLEETPFHIRAKDNAEFYVDTLEEALDEFINEDGYRLTLKAGEHELVIRRGPWEADTYGIEAAAAIVRRTSKET